jgi:RNA polymerase sigma-70 factor (ECF subfamily)
MTHSKTADGEIIDSLLLSGVERRRGEEKLFNNYSYFIREGIRKYSISPDEAFDAYSDTILSAIEKIVKGSFEGRSSLKTYLFQIFHNKCVDQLRKNATKKSSVHQTVPITDMLYQVADAAKTVVQKLVEKTDWDVMKQKLNELGENCQKLLLLSADGYSDKEIALSLEYKTPEVVKTSRLRCLEKLRQLVKRT